VARIATLFDSKLCASRLQGGAQIFDVKKSMCEFSTKADSGLDCQLRLDLPPRDRQQKTPRTRSCDRAAAFRKHQKRRCK
jgi:hypothetical protein